METVARDYAPKGVKFYYIYKALAHPELNGYVTPYTLEERLLHVREARRTLGSSIPWLCDTLANDAKHGLGNAPNSEFVLDAEGKVVRRRAWSNPALLRKDLAELFGAVDPPTKVEDLKLTREPPPKVAKSGVVPRVKTTGRMTALVVRPQRSDSPFYVKLRAEVNEAWRKGNEGQLYLGLHLDPLYHVHWNNLVAPVKYSLELPDGVTVSQASGVGPKVEDAADIDPREFLLELKGNSKSPLTLTVDYFACNDDEGWCKPVRQQYEILLTPDTDGGSVQSRNRGPLVFGANADPKAPLPAGIIQAQIVKVNAEQRQLVIRSPRGAERTIVVPESARIDRDDEPAEFESLAPGDRLRARLAQPAKPIPEVDRIDARSPR